ncbi:uncharacterized protein METZ01_LOCUS157580 [marine metagenome]|uniref:Uncharacterized protein n=1 Tax=marine metagenome TaxID=408172 RepID=A0A382AT68_9ZZZZ
MNPGCLNRVLEPHHFLKLLRKGNCAFSAATIVGPGRSLIANVANTVGRGPSFGATRRVAAPYTVTACYGGRTILGTKIDCRLF